MLLGGGGVRLSREEENPFGKLLKRFVDVQLAPHDARFEDALGDASERNGLFRRKVLVFFCFVNKTDGGMEGRTE